MLDTRKLPRRSMSLLDRLNKSDAEEKSLSNDESPLPSCPRQPPDGVETPSEAIEKVPDLPSRLPPCISTGWCKTRPRYSYSSRTQDARSEASVKDKIAMFSVETTNLSDKSDKCNTLPSRSHSTVRRNFHVTPSKTNFSEITSLDRRLTKSQDNLDETSPVYKRQLDRPEAVGAIKTSIDTKKYVKSENNIKPLFYGSTTTLQSDMSIARPIYHARSISDDNSKEKVSSFKSNLDYLIEQRKKSMSKLRGLVIPEMKATVVDLPEIKVQDAYSKLYFQNSTSVESRKERKPYNSNSFNLNESKWKTNFIPSNLPKYSPAFKRKSLQIYSSLTKESSPEQKLFENLDIYSKITNSPLISTNNDYPVTQITNQFYNKNYQKNCINNNMHEFKNVEIKVCTTTDIVDSDNDSAMSSTQSSYRSSASSPMQTIETVESDSSRLSPRISNYVSYPFIKSDVPLKNLMTEKSCNEYVKRNICRSVSSDTNISLSSSAGSAATSGSQASCSSLESSVADSDKRRVSKGHDIDTINRRNILASAKCRSGRDAKVNSPVLEMKFNHESYNRSPSPTIKPPECLSTLTSAVSAIANKGEIRRRNMIVVESDSDTGSEKNVRLRKQEYKNARLKRNSSSSSKQKIEINNENGKTNDIMSLNSVEGVEVQDNSDIKIGKLLCSRDDDKNNKLTSKNSFNKENNKTIFPHSQQNMLDNRLPITKELQKTTKELNLLPNNITKDESLEVCTQIIRLRKGTGMGIGLILAGGIDCEAKDVTVHRVLSDSIAAKAGIKRGSKIISINGSSMAGLSHAESVSILKEHRAEIIIEIANESKDKECTTDSSSKDGVDSIPSDVVEHGLETNKNKSDESSLRPVVTVFLEKAGGGAGLGFGLDGGRDSPLGDRPLTIKKLFSGGAAAQSGRVVVGAELLSAGGQSMEGFTRTQAWAALKALPAGPVALILRNPTTAQS